jgi:hypothetical protein
MSFFSSFDKLEGHQAISRRLPTAAARDRAQYMFLFHLFTTREPALCSYNRTHVKMYVRKDLNALSITCSLYSG